MADFQFCDGFIPQNNNSPRMCPIRLQCQRYKPKPENNDSYLTPRMSKLNTCLDFMPDSNPRSNPYESENY